LDKYKKSNKRVSQPSSVTYPHFKSGTPMKHPQNI